MDTKARLKTILAEEMNLPDLTSADYDDAAPLFGEALGLDSLDAVELVILIKKHFGLEIADMSEGKTAFSSLNALVAYIDQHLPA